MSGSVARVPEVERWGTAPTCPACPQDPELGGVAMVEHEATEQLRAGRLVEVLVWRCPACQGTTTTGPGGAPLTTRDPWAIGTVKLTEAEQRAYDRRRARRRRAR